MEGIKAAGQIVFTYMYPASPEKVWRAWTDPDALRQWWAQADAPGWRARIDLRVGGRYQFVLRDPEGVYHDVRGVYREVVPNRRLVFTWNLHDGTPERESLVTVILNPLGNGGTELVFRQEPAFDSRARDGWRGAFERLGQLLQEN